MRIDLKASYDNDGFVAVKGVFSEQTCRSILRKIRLDDSKSPVDWDKGWAVSSHFWYEIASQSQLLDVVRQLIGRNILLWGASLIRKGPDAFHPWHCDIEHLSVNDGEVVSVWIGLENTFETSSLMFIPRSHEFPNTIQEVRFRKGVERMKATTQNVVQWAQEIDSDSQVQMPLVSNGDAVFFHGRIWHGSQNKSGKARSALLLQYATPLAKIRIPYVGSYDWPFRYAPLPWPSCILLEGDDQTGNNLLVNPPISNIIKSRLQILKNRIHQLQLPLPLEESSAWQPHYIFNGRTAGLDNVTCHVSVLRKGHSPHPPHTHREEELLIVLSGMADVILPEVPSSEGDFHHRLNAGDFVYYPAWFPHTLVGVSEEPVNYLMFKWFCDVAQEQEKELPHSKHTAFSSSNSYGSNTIRYQALFDGPTRCLRKLHCHCTIINPGASYAAHVDPYDVAILVLDGTVETDGQVAEKGAVIFYPAGQPHGMKNTTEEIAKYIVFEFHGAHDFSENELAPLTMNVPKAVDEDEDRAKLRDLERIVALHKHQVEGLERSYSLFIGRLITRSIIFLFGWIPPVKMWIKNL